MEKSNCWSVMLIDVGTSQVTEHLFENSARCIAFHRSSNVSGPQLSVVATVGLLLTCTYEPPVGKKSTYLELSVGATCAHLIQNGFEEKHN